MKAKFWWFSPVPWISFAINERYCKCLGRFVRFFNANFNTGRVWPAINWLKTVFQKESENSCILTLTVHDLQYPRLSLYSHMISLDMNMIVVFQHLVRTICSTFRHLLRNQLVSTTRSIRDIPAQSFRYRLLGWSLVVLFREYRTVAGMVWAGWMSVEFDRRDRESVQKDYTDPSQQNIRYRYQSDYLMFLK